MPDHLARYRGLQWLHNAPVWNGIVFTPLQVARDILAELGNPQNSFKSIHIAGTNGKGTVSSLLSHMLTKSGDFGKIGLMTSPHLHVLNERCRINHEIIDDDSLDSALLEVKEVCERLEVTPTYFTILTCAIFRIFQIKKIDLGVIEVGLGGCNDATNVMNPSLCSVITTIGLDHQEQLGYSLREIAFNKAGIIKKGSPVVVGDLPDEALSAVIQEVCDKNVEIFRLGVEYQINNGIFNTGAQSYKIYEPNQLFLPQYLMHNLAIALQILNMLSYDFTKIQSSLQTYEWNRRFELRVNENVRSHVIIDGAHNIDGIKSLLHDITRYVETYETIRGVIFFVSFLKRKMWKDCVKIISEHIKVQKNISYKFIACEYSNEFVSATEYAEITDIDQSVVSSQELLAVYEGINPCSLMVHFGSLKQVDGLEEMLEKLGFNKQTLWARIS